MGNVFKSDRPLPPEKPVAPKGPAPKPFKHSSPPKKIGGRKAGCFDPYPSHSADSYTVKAQKKVTTNSSGKLFHAIPGPKSQPTLLFSTKTLTEASTGITTKPS